MDICKVKQIDIIMSCIIGKGAYGIVYKVNNENTVFKKMDTYLYYYIDNNILSYVDKNKNNIESHRNKIIEFNYFILTELSNYCILNNINNICKVNNLYLTDSYIGIKMDYSGIALSKYIKNTYNISLDIIKNIIYKLCICLIEMHNNWIIHCDIKPDNILIDDDNNIKLIDFGLSKFIVDDSLKDIYTEIQTIWYRAPEQILGIDLNTYKIDVWSVGIIFFELLINSCGVINAYDNNVALRNILYLIGLNNISKKYQDDLMTVDGFNPLNYPQDNMFDTYLIRFKDHPEYDDIKDLLVNILNIDPEKRFSYYDILNHKLFNDIRETNPVPLKLKEYEKLNLLDYHIDYNFIKKNNSLYFENRHKYCDTISKYFLKYYISVNEKQYEYDISYCISYLDRMASIEVLDLDNIIYYIIAAICIQKTIHHKEYNSIQKICNEFNTLKILSTICISSIYIIDYNLVYSIFNNICEKLAFNFNIGTPILYDKLLINLKDATTLVDYSNNKLIEDEFKNIILKCQIHNKTCLINHILLIECCFMLLYTKYNITNEYINNILENLTLNHSKIIQKIKSIL